MNSMLNLLRFKGRIPALILGVLFVWLQASAVSAASCQSQRKTPQLPTDLKMCASLAEVIRKPGGLPLAEYQSKLGKFLQNFCHRDSTSGWVRDKRVRDTGPYTVRLVDKEWVGSYHGTHAPVVIWYSQEMFEWLKTNRPPGPSSAPAQVQPVPDGAVMVKEMFQAPAAACADVDPNYLLPTSGAAVMVRDNTTSKDGWFSGWYGWTGWTPDWPANNTNRLAYSGFGQYCMNCHASATDNLTFASLKNIQGQPGEPLTYLSQYSYDAVPPVTHHQLVRQAAKAAPVVAPLADYNPAFTASLVAGDLPRPTAQSVVRMPSETYDNVWMPGDGPNAASQYLTSDQCLGCHDAGSTGLQFDMTQPDPHSDKLLNLSPYGTWRSSPMGLAGRDPIFFAQLASETETFHPDEVALIEDACLGCHGILGQRQFGIDKVAADNSCGKFRRSMLNAIPWPAGNPGEGDARYGALARDGISCMACHHMVQGPEAEQYADAPQNHCVLERQEFFNSDEKGFARSFTGSFLVGSPDELYGPFKDPKTKPMERGLGITPTHNSGIQKSELCGSCHTVHLPVLHKGKVIANIYEQTTYPEWVFSSYRTGDSNDGPLPGGKGERAQSCQGCHMPSRDENGVPYRSKIASIQERSNFPEAENILPAEEIDLPERDGFALHTLVGLNVFLINMAQQFPDVLGLRKQDPMLVSKGVDSLDRTEQAMLDQAAEHTADISISNPVINAGQLSATVTVTNKTGHKFPSGTGFRRAFIHFEVLDTNNAVLWASGRTNGAGIIVDQHDKPVAGELWWKDDCSARITPEARLHQPHYQVVSQQDQAQVYQELVSAPPASGVAHCGHDEEPAGHLTTSFLSICADVKDNRLLPHGMLPLPQRVEIAKALGAGADLAADVGATAVGGDPDYISGGGDSVVYRVDRTKFAGQPVSVRASLYFQAISPFYLQDRFCTSNSEDTQRLYYLAGHLNLEGTAAEDWKLKVVSTKNIKIQ